MLCDVPCAGVVNGACLSPRGGRDKPWHPLQRRNARLQSTQPTCFFTLPSKPLQEARQFAALSEQMLMHRQQKQQRQMLHWWHLIAQDLHHHR